jgi:hypothetical protein
MCIFEGRSLTNLLSPNMKQTDLINIFCKTFGLYFIIQAVVNIKDIFFYETVFQFYEDDNSTLYFMVGQCAFNFIFNLLAAWILICKSKWITSKIIKNPNETIEFTIQKTDLIELILIAISGLLIIHSFPEILNKMTNYIYLNPYDRIEKDAFWTSKQKADIAYSIFKFATGILILTNTRQLAKRLTKIGDKDDNIEQKNEKIINS